MTFRTKRGLGSERRMSGSVPGSGDGRTRIIAASIGAVALVVAASIAAVASCAGGDGGETAPTIEVDVGGVLDRLPADDGADETTFEGVCRDGFAQQGYTPEFADAVCPKAVARMRRGESVAQVLELPEFQEEVCVEVGRRRYDAGEVTNLDRDSFVALVRVRCRAEVRESAD